MYIKAYLDLSLRSRGLFACCVVARAPESLAGGFLVAVAGRALLLFACLRDLGRKGPVFSFTFSPAQWALPQLNGPVQLHSLVVDKTVD